MSKSIEGDVVERIAAKLLGNVNAPEGAIYRVAREIFEVEITSLRSENERLLNIIAEIVKAHGTGQLELNSPEIGGHDDIPLHPWHEEWLYRARSALGDTTNG